MSEAMKDGLAIQLRKEAKSWAGWPHPTNLIAMLNEAADRIESLESQLKESEKRVEEYREEVKTLNNGLDGAMSVIRKLREAYE